MPHLYSPHNHSSRIIKLTLWLINLSLILLTTPAGLFPLAGGSTSFGSPALVSTAATSGKSKITARAKAAARLNSGMKPGYSRARRTAGAQSVIAISGKNTTGTEGIGGVTLTLSSPNNSRFRARTTRSTVSGTYTFSNLPAGFTYTLSPAKTYYTFTPAGRTFTNLKVNQANQDFVGVLKTYSISGWANVSMAGNTETGLGGVTMTLTCSRPRGFTPRTATTDSNGFYSFPGVPIAGDYIVTASKKNYTFDLNNHSYMNLSDNQTYQNFTAQLNSYSIGGNALVRDVTVTLSGSATGTTLSDSAGNYLFSNLTPAGNYTITVSKQDYTFDSTSKDFTDLSGNQTADFAITASPSHVLEFNGAIKRVNYGNYWLPGVDLGHFFWEFWAMPGPNTGGRYLLSDGYGGAHALLFGFYSARSGYTLGGNVYTGSKTITFGSDEGPVANEWGHVAVGWDGKTIVTYFDGVPVGMAAFAGPRRTIGHSGGGGVLYIGGSTHQNLSGRIAQLRGYEGSNPLEDESGNNPPLSAFTPQTVLDCGDPFWQNCSLLSSFIQPARPVADLSGNNVIGKLGGLPPPEFVVDPTAPTASGTSTPVPPADTSPSPPSVPDDALVFDSFSRRNSTYMLGGTGGMGSTEGGTAGSQQWQYDTQPDQKIPFGILNARAVMLSNEAHAAWVATGSTDANLTVSAERWPGRWRTGISTGLVFRLQDATNFFCAYTTGDTAATQLLHVASVVNGVTTTLASDVAMPAQWSTLRVKTLSTGSIDVYANATLVYSTTSDVLANATNAGIWNWGQNQGLANRWDNFTVREIPITDPPATLQRMKPQMHADKKR